MTIGGKTVSIQAGAGVKKPDGPRFDLEPGDITVQIKRKDGSQFTEKITAAADETWGVILLPGGPLSLPIY